MTSLHYFFDSDRDEKKREYFKIQVRPDLNANYIYSIPISVSTVRNESNMLVLTANAREKTYSMSEVTSAMVIALEEEKKQYSQEVLFVCQPQKPYYYDNEIGKIKCILTNNGKTNLRDVDVCLSRSCTKTTALVGQQGTSELTFPADSVGRAELGITAKSRDIVKHDRISVDLRDPPKLVMEKLLYPSVVGYGEQFNISGVLVKKSYSVPSNANVKLVYDKNKEARLTVDEVYEDQPFLFNLSAELLEPGQNKLALKLFYTDENGRAFEDEKEIIISYTKINTFQRVWIFFKSFFNNLKENLF